MKRIILFVVIAISISYVSAQKNFWSENSYEELNLSGTQYIYPETFKSFDLDYNATKDYLFTAPLYDYNNLSSSNVEILLPLPNGNTEVFKIVESPVYDSELAAKYPNIKTFLAYCPNHPEWYTRLDITPMGFHAMILGTEEGTVFIDPTTHLGADINKYLIYYKKDFTTNKVFECNLETSSTNQTKSNNTAARFGDCQLRTYRLAVAATGEYTAFHGGTVAGALAAQVTTMNRVNGVYERAMSITMVLVGNNDLIIYTNGGTDPYTNGNGGTMLGENQANIDNIIGTANYDIGHVFSTGGGGIASLQSPCSTTRKAQGVTGQNAPIGDPFDIDYVAHEMGHQFGGNHTQNNNCNRNGATAMEPGSASTIMGYAGICAPNVQNNSDDYFHGITLEEMGDFVTGATHTCPVTTVTGNNPPTVTYPSANITIPANTPFALTAVAFDPDPTDVITYCWEQMDNETATMSPVSTSTVGPAFRSFDPTTNPTRYFPNLADVVAGVSPTWEVLPSVTRNMDFRVVVRDNAPGAGCNDHIDITVAVDGGSGPFIVNNPSNTGITWTGNTTETVTWAVANTDIAPVSCSNVNILISYDGGLSFPDTLASNVTNDGSQVITVPNVASTTALVIVQCDNGTFFDVSNNTFTILAITNDFTLDASPNAVTVCEGNDAVFNIIIDKLGVFNNNVALSVTGLPAGLTTNLSSNNQTPVFNSTLTISNTSAVAGGTYTFSVEATSTSGTKTKNLSLTIIENLSGAPNLISPVNASTNISTPLTLTWSSIANTQYQIDIASDISFNNIIETSSGIAGTSYTSGSLAANTTFYWRVIASNSCDFETSSTFSFTTANCISVNSTDIPVNITNSGTPTITSNLLIAGASGVIDDINVINLTGSHTYIQDLVFVLTSPLGTVDTLLNNICGNQNNFDINFDDAATNNNYPCPPTDGGTYIPENTLAMFNGEDANGTWVLTVHDEANQDGGDLNSWGLELCFSATCPPVMGTDITIACDSALVDGSWYFSSTSFNDTLVAGANTGCDSITTYNVTINDSYATNETITACNSILINGTTYSSSQVITTNYTATNSCDSVHTINLIINNSTSGSENLTACDVAIINGASYSSSQTVSNTFTGVNGCDSVHTVNLTINSSSPTTTINLSSCNPADVSSTTAVLMNAVGCDSVVITNTTLINGGTSTNNTTACDSALVNGTWYYASTSFMVSYANASANGCDSIATFNILINDSYATNEMITACNSILINGTTYSSSQVITTNYTATNSCDSVHTINLIINNSTSGSENLTACDVAIINGTSYTSSQTVSNTFTWVNGCDSVHTVNLTINSSSPTTIVNLTSCNPADVGSTSVNFTNSVNCDSLVITNTSLILGSSSINNTTACDSAFVNGSWYFSSTSFIETYANASANGCDSSATFNVSINNSLTTSSNLTACGQVTLNGMTYTTSQAITSNFLAQNGCDSTHTFNLTINSSSPTTLLNQTSCNPADVGTSTVLLINSNGCDSIVVTNTTLISGGNGVINVSACDSAFANGTWFFNSTSFNENFPNASSNGCDSTITYNVFVNSSTTGSANVSGCNSVFFNGVTYFNSAIDTAVYVGLNSCDSVHYTNITVYNIDTSLVQNNATLTTNQLGASYQWLDCSNGNSPILGATNISYTASTNGSYAVEITLNGCTFISECVTITSIGISDVELESILEVYPNPTNGSFVLEFSENVAELKASIYTIEGKLLYFESVSNSASLPLVINASAGVYFLKVETNLGATVIKVVKK